MIRMVNRIGSMGRMDSVDSTVETPVQGGEGGLDAPPDPGHLMSKLMGGGVTGEGVPAKRYEFAIETSMGPSIFHRTKVRLPSFRIC